MRGQKYCLFHYMNCDGKKCRNMTNHPCRVTAAVRRPYINKGDQKGHHRILINFVDVHLTAVFDDIKKFSP